MDMQSRERQSKRRQQRLQRSVVQLQREVAALEICLEQQGRSEQVLTDIIQVMESISHIRQMHLAQHAQQGEYGAPVVPHASPTAAQEVPSLRDAEQGIDSCDTFCSLESVLEAVPSYCCAADLMFRAAPQWVQRALTLRVSDISRLLTNTFYELLALLEFESRTRAEPAAAASTAAAGVPELGGSPAPPPGCCLSDASAAGQPRDNSAQVQQQATAAAAQHPQAPAQPPTPQLPYSSDLRRLVDRFFGLLAIILVLQPLPLFGAATCNHREQQQGTPPAQHWMDVTRRLQLTPTQLAYLSTGLCKVRHLHQGSVRQFGWLLRHAASPSLSLLAAQQQLPHWPVNAAGSMQQQQPMPPGSEALQSPAASTASQEVTPTPTVSCSEVQLSTQLQHMATYPAVMTLLLLDTLTVTQKALWIIGSYPWVPAPVALCGCAEQLLKQQQQQHGPAAGAEEAGTADPTQEAPVMALSPPAAAGQETATERPCTAEEVAACWDHLQQRRRRWQLEQSRRHHQQQQQQRPFEACSQQHRAWKQACELEGVLSGMNLFGAADGPGADVDGTARGTKPTGCCSSR